MYERLLDKNDPPTTEFIKGYIGEQSYTVLSQFEDFLRKNYNLAKEMKFPFGNSYGWGYKYGHKTSHLCYVFFESQAITVTMQLGDNCVPKIEEILPTLSQKARDLWKNRYPCGVKGGWIHYRILNQNELKDVIELVKVKKKPAKV